MSDCSSCCWHPSGRPSEVRGLTSVICCHCGSTCHLREWHRECGPHKPKTPRGTCSVCHSTVSSFTRDQPWARWSIPPNSVIWCPDCLAEFAEQQQQVEAP